MQSDKLKHVRKHWSRRHSGRKDTRELVKGLLNFVEQLSSNLCEARAEIQRLRGEVNRLKGEQGKPEIKANVSEAPKKHSSEKERKKPRKRQEKKKTASIVIEKKFLKWIKRSCQRTRSSKSTRKM